MTNLLASRLAGACAASIAWGYIGLSGEGDGLTFVPRVFGRHVMGF